MNSLTLKKLFLLDSAGALLTAVLTGIVLANVAEAIGLPRPALRGLGWWRGCWPFTRFSISISLRLAILRNYVLYHFTQA